MKYNVLTYSNPSYDRSPEGPFVPDLAARGRAGMISGVWVREVIFC